MRAARRLFGDKKTRLRSGARVRVLSPAARSFPHFSSALGFPCSELATRRPAAGPRPWPVGGRSSRLDRHRYNMLYMRYICIYTGEGRGSATGHNASGRRVVGAGRGRATPSSLNPADCSPPAPSAGSSPRARRPCLCSARLGFPALARLGPAAGMVRGGVTGQGIV